MVLLNAGYDVGALGFTTTNPYIKLSEGACSFPAGLKNKFLQSRSLIILPVVPFPLLNIILSSKTVIYISRDVVRDINFAMLV